MAITYRNTFSTVPHWVGTPLHESHPRGVAYETNTHFVHLYGQDSGLWTIAPGLAVTERANGTLRDWVARAFGAQDIIDVERPVGESVAGVWRPGISDYDNIRQGLSTTNMERHAALQSVRLLLERLDDILVYVEPSATTLSTYGHKLRELLILACTDVESAWKQWMQAARRPPAGRELSTRDYVLLRDKLYLAEYEVAFNAHSLPPVRPFESWDAAAPTQSLAWYHAYNQTKHDRQAHFDKATLRHCLEAVCAYIVLFSARFSPYPLYHEGGATSALYRQHFDVRLSTGSPASFYVPSASFPPNFVGGFSILNLAQQKLLLPWTVRPFTL